MSDLTAWPAAKARVRAFILRNQAAVRTAVVVDASPIKELVLNVVTSEVTADLTSGQDHVHRGRRSMSGQAKLQVYQRALGELRDLGFITEEDAEAGQAALRKDIAGAG